MVWFLLEDDRSRDWSDSDLRANLHLVRPQIRPFIFEYRRTGFDVILKDPNFRKLFGE